jgi:hypothetical protein
MSPFRITKSVELPFRTDRRQHLTIVLDFAVEGRFLERHLVTMRVELDVYQLARQ